MPRRFSLIIAMFICFAAVRTADAQRDSARTRGDTVVTHMLRLRDGSTLIGTLVSRDSVSLRFETNGGVLTIPVANVTEIRQIAAAEVHGDQYWFPDPNRTRLFFAPTGRMLEKGEGYYSNTYLFLQNFVGGLSDKVTFGGGFSVIPSNDFLNNNVYYLTPKVSLFSSPKTNAAVGALVGFVPTDNGHSFGILYGVATQGNADGSVTAGLGYGYVDGSLSQHPIVMLGGESRVSRRVALVTENYGYWGNGGSGGAVFSYGLRFMGEKLSTDFAFWNSSSNWLFPGIPYISFAVKF